MSSPPTILLAGSFKQLIWILSFSLLGSAGCATPQRPDEAIASHFIKEHTETSVQVQRIEIKEFRVGDETVYLAAVDSEAHWWGTFYCFGMRQGEIDWIADYLAPEGATPPLNNFVYEFYGWQLAGYDGPLIEVFDSSHQGNGSLSVYELRGHSLKLLLETWAVRKGTSFGSTLIGGQLQSTWADLNNDGIDDLTLTGQAVLWDERADIIVGTESVKRVFHFDPSKDQLVEDDSARKGLLR